MRCKAKVKVWFKEKVSILEPNDSGVLEEIRVTRITWTKQQCTTTTRQKSAQCWRELGMCGKHAAEHNPLFYPKAKGHRTGGRHGKGFKIKSTINVIELTVK